MSRFAAIVLLFATVCSAGCYYSRIVATSDASDFGDSIHTRFRYRPICDGNYSTEELMSRSQKLQMFQPEVFDDNGVPVVLSFSDTLKDVSWLSTLQHLHRSCSMSVAERYLASVEACSREALMLYFFPIPLMNFSCSDSPCFRSGRIFRSNRYGSTSDFIRDFYCSPCDDDCDMAMAYGIASRLKEAEDAGKIDERFAVKAIFAQSISNVSSTMAKIRADSMARRGETVKHNETRGESQFEIVRCDQERGQDFACTFTLRSRKNSALKLSDYSIIRNGLRSAIRTHYLASHPDVSPRTLVIDFTKYEVEGRCVNGRVAVLTISPESMTYDSVRCRGVISVLVGEGQFEDARRWIRRNLAKVAARSNIALDGDAVPQGGRFYSESEEMRDGVLKVYFWTE